MKEKKNKLWLYCIQVLYRHVVPCFHNTTYKYRKGMKGPVINYYSVSQIILSIVDQETEFVAIPEYCLPS